MPRVDIRHLNSKNALKSTVDKASAYADTMAHMHKAPSRIIVSRADYDALHRRAQSHHPNRTVFLCLGDVLVHWHSDPVDETEIAPVSRYPTPARYDLPPVNANPFGMAPPEPVAPVTDDSFDDAPASSYEDDDIPF